MCKRYSSIHLQWNDSFYRYQAARTRGSGQALRSLELPSAVITNLLAGVRVAQIKGRATNIDHRKVETEIFRTD